MKPNENRKYDPVPPGKKRIFTPYITVNGKRIQHPHGGLFVFDVDDDDVDEAN